MGLRVEEFVLQSRQLRVIQRELELESTISHAAPLAQEGDHLIHDRDEVHPVSSLRLRRQRGSGASSLTGARSPRLRRRRGHSLTCPLPCLALCLYTPVG